MGWQRWERLHNRSLSHPIAKVVATVGCQCVARYGLMAVCVGDGFRERPSLPPLLQCGAVFPEIVARRVWGR